MSTFLNLSLDKKINTNFLIKHILFSLLWFGGILLFVFRIDVLLFQYYSIQSDTLLMSIPTIYILSVILSFFLQKWYYTLIFFFYPLLMVFWFIPKTILSSGKIFLFGNYVISVVTKLYNYKLTIINVFLLLLSSILFATISSNWSIWQFIAVISYFYIKYLLGILNKSFKTPAIFSSDIFTKIRSFIHEGNPEESLVIKSYINQKEDEKVEVSKIREIKIRRAILATTAIDHVIEKLNCFNTKQAFLKSMIFGALLFMIISVLFFWFVNLQIFNANATNFKYSGEYPAFDFLYYTVKTITFGDIELIKPITPLARIIEMGSFFIIGIFILVILLSLGFSLKQDKLIEDVKLTTDLIKNENLTLAQYFHKEFGMEMKQAFSEVKNIDVSIKNLKDIIDKII